MSDDLAARKALPLWLSLLLGALVFSALCVAAFVVGIIASMAASAAEAPRAAEAVRNLDAAYERVDCDAFESLVAEDLRERIVEGSYSCSEWRDVASQLTIDGQYAYSVSIKDTVVRGGRATVTTTESWDGDDSADEVSYSYSLTKVGGDWIIVGYTEE